MNSKVETTVMDMLKSLKEDKEAMFRPFACLKDTPKDMHTVAKRFGEMSGLVTHYLDSLLFTFSWQRVPPNYNSKGPLYQAMDPWSGRTK